MQLIKSTYNQRALSVPKKANYLGGVQAGFGKKTTDDASSVNGLGSAQFAIGKTR